MLEQASRDSQSNVPLHKENTRQPHAVWPEQAEAGAPKRKESQGLEETNVGNKTLFSVHSAYLSFELVYEKTITLLGKS